MLSKARITVNSTLYTKSKTSEPSSTTTITTTNKLLATTASKNRTAIHYQHSCWHFVLCYYCCLLACIVQQYGIQAEISTVADSSGARDGGSRALLNNFHSSHCSAPKFNKMAKTIDDVEDLDLDVPVNIAFEHRQKKRFLLHLNSSAPLTINFSQIVSRKIYFNQTANMLRAVKMDQRSMVLPCALRGQYDVFVQARRRGSVKIEATAVHPDASWVLINSTHHITIRSENRVRKRQMIVRWQKSKIDHHAVKYCLVVSTKHVHRDFCQAAEEYATSLSSIPNRRNMANSCPTVTTIETIFSRPPEKSKKISPNITNVICTGSRTKQLIRGLTAHHIYHLDVFGIHTKLQNLTFHMASSTMHFNRTHPATLRGNHFSIVKISAMHGVQVFSYKIPYHEAPQTLRYLILPCGGSEVDAKILKQRKLVTPFSNIYKPTYIKIPQVREGERYMIRFKPSNDDEVLRANKIGLSVTTNKGFNHLPELPDNITVFELGKTCRCTKIAWFSSPEIRTMSYCIVVLHLPQRNRSSIDYTDYCTDFGKNIINHTLFDQKKCLIKSKNPPAMETETILNLTPGETYLIYVTVKLSDGRSLPYQSLKVQMRQHCTEEYDAKDPSACY